MILCSDFTGSALQVVDLRASVESGKVITGSFLIDGTADLNTTAVLQTDLRDGTITVTLQSPANEEITLTNQDGTNWFLPDSAIAVSWKNLTAVGSVRLFISLTDCFKTIFIVIR